ncbi:MAG TPA: EscU/YscU/HrcU family type III secretion system export apparatus switch protein [Solirubrobacteraceae bacterium]|nr:EscU/YscU/HrcU family type III secretion system export apparatus switch protein [Solirubrobacteraceae bacterium]
MAAEERTEKATPKHRKRARERGQVARSGDLGGAVVLIGGLATLAATGPQIVSSGASVFRLTLGAIARPGQATTAAGLTELMHMGMQTVLVTVAPVAIVCMVAGVLVGAAQVGVRPSVKALQPDFRRINPASGARNLLGPNTLFEAVKALAKVSVVGVVAGLALLPGLQDLAAKVGIAPGALGAIFGERALAIAERAAIAYLLIGLLDYAYKRFQHERKLRMTKQQVKDEARQYGVSGEVKAAQRRRQAQAARARMMAAVPGADVVVTNPTHYAVALLYDRSRSAPEVVAKGQNLIAAQIRRIASEHEVPVMSDPPLARALHSSTEIGQLIPQELFAAVASVLAFVYRLAGRRSVAA